MVVNSDLVYRKCRDLTLPFFSTFIRWMNSEKTLRILKNSLGQKFVSHKTPTVSENF